LNEIVQADYSDEHSRFLVGVDSLHSQHGTRLTCVDRAESYFSHQYDVLGSECHGPAYLMRATMCIPREAVLRCRTARAGDLAVWPRVLSYGTSTMLSKEKAARPCPCPISGSALRRTFDWTQ
jgi:hypothetical protein